MSILRIVALWMMSVCVAYSQVVVVPSTVRTVIDGKSFYLHKSHINPYML